MLEHDINKSKVLAKENEELRFKNLLLERKMSVVEWYMHVMEDGIDTKEISKVYTELKQKHERLKKKT